MKLHHQLQVVARCLAAILISCVPLAKVSAQTSVPNGTPGDGTDVHKAREVVSTLVANESKGPSAMLYFGLMPSTIKGVSFTTDKIYLARQIILPGGRVTRTTEYMQIDLYRVSPESITQDVNDCSASPTVCTRRPAKLIAPYGTRENVGIQPLIELDGAEAQTALVSALTVLHNAVGKVPDDEQTRFDQVVSAHRAGRSEPIPEEARRLQIQAEDAVREKHFVQAQTLYAQATEIAPWWADGYFNRAAVLAEISDYAQAIIEMQRYLALAPNASDARTAQDKIYSWQGKLH